MNPRILTVLLAFRATWDHLSMAPNLLSCDRDQLYLMPPSVRDWLPEGHLAFFVLDVVEELDVSGFYDRFRVDGKGGAGYDPAMMLAVLLYAYATGERSSRRIERRLREDVAYRVLAANHHPDHSTLARFRQRNEAEIAQLFTQVLALCVKAGLVDTGLVAIDGTKMSANASYFANMTKEELAKAILDEAARTDAEEDERFGDKRGDELPEQWANPKDRRSRIKEAFRQLEEETTLDYEGRMAERARKEKELGKKLTGPQPTKTPAHPRSPRKRNVTDPDSRVMPLNGKGVIQGYNPQAASTEGHIIVAAELSNCPNDARNFVPVVEAMKENLATAGHDAGIGTILADAGYWTTQNATTETGSNLLISTISPRYRRAPRPSDDKLAVLQRVSKGELSQRKAGEILGVSYTWINNMSKRYFPPEGEPMAVSPTFEVRLPVIEKVSRGELSMRKAAVQLGVSVPRVKELVHRLENGLPDPDQVRDQMNAKLAEEGNKALYKRRTPMIEPIFGDIKFNRGYRRFMRRGASAVGSEWRLICATNNLLKLWRSAPAS